MKELMKKLMDAGRKDAFNSLDELVAAATELGYTEEQINDLLDEFDGFPLDDDDLEEITGGQSIRRASAPNYAGSFHPVGCTCGACGHQGIDTRPEYYWGGFGKLTKRKITETEKKHTKKRFPIDSRF